MESGCIISHEPWNSGVSEQIVRSKKDDNGTVHVVYEETATYTHRLNNGDPDVWSFSHVGKYADDRVPMLTYRHEDSIFQGRVKEMRSIANAERRSRFAKFGAFSRWRHAANFFSAVTARNNRLKTKRSHAFLMWKSRYKFHLFVYLASLSNVKCALYRWFLRARWTLVWRMLQANKTYLIMGSWIRFPAQHSTNGGLVAGASIRHRRILTLAAKVVRFPLTLMKFYWKRLLKGIDAVRVQRALKELGEVDKAPKAPKVGKSSKRKKKVIKQTLAVVPEEAEASEASEASEAEAAGTPQSNLLVDLASISLIDDCSSNHCESTIGGTTTCIVCFTGEKTHTAVPCGHQCACRQCSNKLKTCPYCRQSVSLWMHVRIV
jgi:hypothetical protein